MDIKTLKTELFLLNKDNILKEKAEAELISAKAYVDKNPNIKSNFELRPIGMSPFDCFYSILTGKRCSNFFSANLIPNEIECEGDYGNSKEILLTGFSHLESFIENSNQDQRDLIKKYMLS